MPGGRGKIRPEDNTNGFQKNPQNINRSGANRKLVSSVNKELENMGVKETTAAEIKSIYLRLVNLQIEELEKMVKDKDQPAMIRIVGKAILSGKGFDIIEKMLDRGIGKADSKLTLDGGINVTNKQDYSDYSTEDLELIANISKKYEKKKD